MYKDCAQKETKKRNRRLQGSEQLPHIQLPIGHFASTGLYAHWSGLWRACARGVPPHRQQYTHMTSIFAATGRRERRGPGGGPARPAGARGVRAKAHCRALGLGAGDLLWVPPAWHVQLHDRAPGRLLAWRDRAGTDPRDGRRPLTRHPQIPFAHPGVRPPGNPDARRPPRLAAPAIGLNTPLQGLGGARGCRHPRRGWRRGWSSSGTGQGDPWQRIRANGAEEKAWLGRPRPPRKSARHACNADCGAVDRSGGGSQGNVRLHGAPGAHAHVLHGKFRCSANSQGGATGAKASTARRPQIRRGAAAGGRALRNLPTSSVGGFENFPP